MCAMRVSAKADYAIRAAAELAAADADRAAQGRADLGRPGHPHQVPRDDPAGAQARGHRAQPARPGRRLALARPAAEINLADVIRAVDGPLANVRGDRPENTALRGRRRRALTDVWIAVRAALREILEHTTLADLVVGRAARAGARRWPPTRTRGSRWAASGAPAEPPSRPLARRPDARRAPDRIRPRRAASAPGHGHADHRLRRGSHVHDLAAGQLEPLGHVARHLRPDTCCRRSAAAPRAPRSRGRRPARSSPRWRSRWARCRMSMSCGRTQALVEPGDRPDEAHHELVGRVLVQLARRADLLDARRGP